MWRTNIAFSDGTIGTPKPGYTGIVWFATATVRNLPVVPAGQNGEDRTAYGWVVATRHGQFGNLYPQDTRRRRFTLLFGTVGLFSPPHALY